MPNITTNHAITYTKKDGKCRGGSRGRVQGVRTPPRDDLRFSNTTGIVQIKKTMWFIGVEVEQETIAPPPKKNPGSAPEMAQTSAYRLCSSSVTGYFASINF